MNGGRGHTVIVGGGVIGICAAYFLALRGAPVTVIDRGPIGGACSFGNAGLISFGHLPIPRPGVVTQALKWMWRSESPLYIAPRLDPALLAWLWRFRSACSPSVLARSMQTLGALSRESRGLFEEIHARTNGAFFYDRRGYMEVFQTRAGLDHCVESAEITKKEGFGYEVIEGEALLAREPALARSVLGAVWYPDSAFCNPHAFVRAAAAAAEALGARFLPNRSVERLDLAGGRARGVVLDRDERVEAEAVVLAAGSWTPALAAQAGARVVMQPAKGYHRDVGMSDPSLTTACIFGEAGMVATPMDGFMRLAGTLEFSGMTESMRRNRLDMLTIGARRYLAAEFDASPRSEWMGMRPCTPDGLPVIGWSARTKGVFIATGHAMLGLTQGPITGKIVAECVCGEKPCVDIEPMRPDRF